ncbi:phage head morphogenesis protein [Bacteroides sp. OttesenSCG-928-J23]|nr:phage head morphogenesis protein [Bacteroides sp. OttesenSCG-928-J23]
MDQNALFGPISEGISLQTGENIMHVNKTTGYVLPLSSDKGPPTYHKKMFGYVVPLLQPNLQKGFLDTYDPPTGKSGKWKHWISIRDLQRCLASREQHGQIYAIDEFPETEPPLHPNCRCKIEIMESVIAGEGSKDGEKGADWWIKNHGHLPDYYITMDGIKDWDGKRGKALLNTPREK